MGVIVKWTRSGGEWRLLGEYGILQGTLITAVTKSGKEQDFLCGESVGEKKGQCVYLYNDVPLQDYGKYKKQDDGTYAILVPMEANTGDIVDVLKKDGDVVQITLGSKIGENLFYGVDQDAKCESCGNWGPVGKVCVACWKGRYIR